jgi:hypothetical protein
MNDKPETLEYYIASLTFKVGENVCKMQNMSYKNKSMYLRFEVFTAVTMKNGVFWVVTPCGSC